MTDEPEVTEAQLQRLMADIPRRRAPARLRRKLRRIPGEHGDAPSLPWLVPRWAFAAAAVPLVAALSLHWHGQWQQHQDIAQGRRDLALALTYLQQARERVNPRLEAALRGSVTGPVADHTLEVLEQSMDFKREYEL